MTYEYKVVDLAKYYLPVFLDTRVDALLNIEGAEGWELVSVASQHAFFIRVLEDDMMWDVNGSAN